MGEPAGAYGDSVLSAFGLDFFDGEQRLRARLGDGWGVRFEPVPPVRGFRWAKGGRGFAGWYWSATTGDHVGYESWLERDRLILLEAMPRHAVEKALWWEGHILEVLHGRGPEVAEDAQPRPEYDPARHSLTVRERAKAAELSAAGHKVSVSTVGNFRRRYQAEGVLGLADRRSVRKRPQFGSVDDVVVAAMRQAIKEGRMTPPAPAPTSFGGPARSCASGGAPVELPSKATLYRLLAKLSQGTHALGTARARRSRAHGAKAPFGQWAVFAPGEVVQIDSAPLDVLVRLDDGVVGKIELTGMIDVATRTVTAAVLRPTTKAVDASVLLARTVTPELMRPGWVDALRMSCSVLPHRRLLSLDERLEHAAAQPVSEPTDPPIEKVPACRSAARTSAAYPTVCLSTSAPARGRPWPPTLSVWPSQTISHRISCARICKDRPISEDVRDWTASLPQAAALRTCCGAPLLDSSARGAPPRSGLECREPLAGARPLAARWHTANAAPNVSTRRLNRQS